ncbi:uncharacterized protein LOC136032611 [Artemia franciscana]|uniref:uncharacterized protein LOC136032611 n=1 Tax=Artemia franciscana TaxID=6661 RepID=UPI0032D9DF69
MQVEILWSPDGSAAGVNPSGWISQDLFCEYLQHFVKHSRASSEQKKLLILDNHELHISLNAVNIAKANGIVLLTVPPHSSHRIQPLEVNIFSPFKPKYNRPMDNWMLNDPGKTVTIYDIAGLVGTSFPCAFTPSNIQSGFAKSGI